MSTFALIYLLLEKYLVPFLFSIGLFYFFYGIIEYFIIGKGGDEERSQHGRELFLKSIGWFTVSLIAHVIVMGFAWLMTLDFSAPTINPNGDVEIRQDPSVLPVPNVPTR